MIRVASKQQAIRVAAQAVIDHAGPECRTDPHIAMDLMGEAIDLGATHADIAAEMRRIREER